MNTDKALKILVVRPDRIGDVILSTPVIQRIKSNFPNARISLLVQEGVAPILKGLSSIEHCLIYDPSGRHAGLTGFWRLIQELKCKKFDLALVLQSHFKIAIALYGAGIKTRIGPLSKLHSFVFYNQGIRQKRSQVEMHEAEYNLQLVEKIGQLTNKERALSQISISSKVLKEAEAWLNEQGWDRSFPPFVVVHPGMGGSALNWPESFYIELIQKLLFDNIPVLITGGVHEHNLMDRIEKKLLEDMSFSSSKKALFYMSAKGQGIDFLAALYHFSGLVIAPSTGPLHVAVALNKPVLTFYPPIRVQSPKRWGPYVSDPDRSVVFVPQVDCGQEFRCIGQKCRYYPCMESLEVDQALKQAKRLLQLSMRKS